MDSFPQFKPSDIDPVVLRGLYVNLTTAKSLSHRLCEADDLRALLHYINPYVNQLLPNSHGTIRRDLETDFLDKKVLIKEALRQAISKVHFSVDGWTSPNQLGIMGVVVHFVGKDRRLHHILLALQELDGAHTGENFADETIALYEDFEILDLIGYMMADNASNNDTMATWIDRELGSRGMIWTSNKY